MTVPGENPAAPAGETPAIPPAVPAPAAPASETLDGEPFDAQRAMRLIEEQRARERALTAQLKELKPLADKARAAEEANKTELEKAQARAAALQAQLEGAQTAHREALIRVAIEREAHAQGAVKADVVYRLLDRSGIELDDAGEVKGADKAVKALLDAEPYLKAVAPPANGGPNPTPRKNGETSFDQQVAATREEMRASGRYSL